MESKLAKRLTVHQLEMLDEGLALDVELIGRPTHTPKVWRLYGFLDGKEYFWGSTGEYVCSIGMTEDGKYYAAADYRFKNLRDPKVTCIWFR